MTYRQVNERSVLFRLNSFQMQNYETNFTMGYFRRTGERDTFGTPTYTTYYLELVAIILRKEAGHEKIVIWSFPFDTATWIMIIVIYIIIGLLNFSQNMEIENGIFKIFKVIIGTPVNNLPNWTSTRIKFMTVIISSFILRSIYQSLLFYIFRTNYYKSPPLTFEGLVADGYTAIATELYLRFLIYVPQIEDKSLPLMLINNTNEILSLRYLQLHRNESLVAMSVIEFVTRFIREELAPGEALQVLPINVKDQQICFYMPKHSYFADRLNQYIMFLHQAGLYLKWREWTLYDYQVGEAHLPTTHVKSLIVNLRQLVGFLFLVIFILLASIVLFGLELMSKNFNWMQKLF